jgi:S1 RNA binding domain protein
MSYSLGESVIGTVSGVTDYGAFVRLQDGESGMIHISKLSREFVSDIRSVIKKGDVVTATVIGNANGKIALSLIGDNPKKQKRVFDNSKNRENAADFESMLSSFKSASEEKLKHFNRNKEHNRRKR